MAEKKKSQDALGLLTDAEIERGIETSNAATVGPWRYCPGPSGTGCECGLIWGTEYDVEVASVRVAEDTGFSATAPLSLYSKNAQFIALARTLLPQALSELRALRAENARLRTLPPPPAPRCFREVPAINAERVRGGLLPLDSPAPECDDQQQVSR